MDFFTSDSKARLKMSCGKRCLQWKCCMCNSVTEMPQFSLIFVQHSLASYSLPSLYIIGLRLHFHVGIWRQDCHFVFTVSRNNTAVISFTKALGPMTSSRALRCNWRDTAEKQKGIFLLWNCLSLGDSKLRCWKMIIHPHGFVGETVWKSLSGEWEGKTTFPSRVLCPSRNGTKWIDETEGEESVSINVCG